MEHIKNKTGEAVTDAFEKILKQERTPIQLQTDDGKEFCNRKFQSFAIQTYVEFYVLKKRKEPLDQLCKGLENLGILSLIRGNPSLMKSYFIVCEVPLTSKDILESFSYYMASEPVDEKSQSADSFLKQAVVKLEEGTVKMTFYITH